MNSTQDIVQEFRDWVFSQEYEDCSFEDEKDKINIITSYARGEINFYEMNVVEFVIISKKTEETKFYIHFQLNDIEHARELFQEMMTTLLAMKKEQIVRVLLCCTSALTTSYFAEKLNEVAKLLLQNYTFEAISYESVYERGLYYDMILLAPQIGFEEEKIHNAMKEIPIITIPASIFGKYDTGALISLVQKTLEAYTLPQTKAQVVEKAFHNTAKILCIGVIMSSRAIRLIYRYYRNGKIITKGEVKKPNIAIQDIMDIVDSLVALYPEIDCIGLTMPGMTRRGVLRLRDFGIQEEHIAKKIFAKYHIICVLSNDCNQTAFGISALEEKYQSLIYHFQPYGVGVGGVGIISDGVLIRGKDAGAGEIDALQSVIAYTKPLDELAKTADGTYEIVTKSIVSEISLLSPEAIFVHSAMAPDIEHLKKLVAQYLPNRELPDMIYINDTTEYLMVGTMLKCLEQIVAYHQKKFDPEFYQ